jgi:hypothetical protein
MKKNFADKAKSILGSRPSSMEDFLSDETKPEKSEVLIPPPLPEEKVEKLEIQETVKPSKEAKSLPLLKPDEDRTERYEWRHTQTMQSRIQLYLLERNKTRKPKNTKVKIVDVIEEAVHAYLKREGF